MLPVFLSKQHERFRTLFVRVSFSSWSVPGGALYPCIFFLRSHNVHREAGKEVLLCRQARSNHCKILSSGFSCAKYEAQMQILGNKKKSPTQRIHESHHHIFKKWIRYEIIILSNYKNINITMLTHVSYLTLLFIIIYLKK